MGYRAPKPSGVNRPNKYCSGQRLSNGLGNYTQEELDALAAAANASGREHVHPGSTAYGAAVGQQCVDLVGFADRGGRDCEDYKPICEGATMTRDEIKAQEVVADQSGSVKLFTRKTIYGRRFGLRRFLNWLNNINGLLLQRCLKLCRSRK